MSSNFQQWGPVLTNIEDDAAYTADTQRANGAPLDATFPSDLANKLYMQCSVMVAAIGQFIANQGFAASDANLANLVIALTAALRALYGSINVVAFSATPVFDLSKALIQEITLTGNVTSSTATNVPTGLVTFIIHQDGTGGWTFAWPAAIPGSLVDPTVSATSVQSFIVDHAGNFHPFTAMTSS
jgi:hypothetical protein